MSCYLCASTKRTTVPGVVRDAPEMQICECLDCGLVYLASKAHASAELYAQGGMHGQAPVPLDTWRKETFPDDSRRHGALASVLANKDVLDFGCGNGGFLELCLPTVRSIDGIELEQRAREELIAQGKAVFPNLESCLRQDKRYDFITLFHVLEHLPDPRSTIRSLSSLLKPGGEIIIEVPHARDALLSLYASEAFSRFTYWSCHLYLFNRHTLAMLVQQAGLQCRWIKYVQRYPLANHLYWLAKNAPGGHKHWHFLSAPALDQAYADQLAAAGITDTLMTGIALP